MIPPVLRPSRRVRPSVSRSGRPGRPSGRPGLSGRSAAPVVRPGLPLGASCFPGRPDSRPPRSARASRSTRTARQSIPSLCRSAAPGRPGRRPSRLASAMAFALVLALCPAWAPADSLAESWSGLLTYQRPPAPPHAEATLRSAWGDLLANYPGAAIEGIGNTLEAARRIPEAYRREHRVYGHGPEGWARRLEPYRPWIDEAAKRFDVPPAVIRAVILQESGGDAQARAKGTSAKGLMQTIDATFALAREALAGDGLHIKDPLTPRDSILAGAWYLAYCFDLAARDHGITADRKNPRTWRRALEYYYAGPGWGRDPRPIIHVYRKGKRTRIHKGRYSDGVLAYVEALETGALPAGT